MIELVSEGDTSEIIKLKLIGNELDQNIMDYINKPINYIKYFKKEELVGPII